MKKNIIFFILISIANIGFSYSGKVYRNSSEKMWLALNNISLLENINFHIISNDKDILKVEDLTCAWENYPACSMFVYVEGKRKMIVHTETAKNIIEALENNGFYLDEENWNVFLKKVECIKQEKEYFCFFSGEEKKK